MPPSSNAGPVLRAGLTEVLVTGIEIRWIRVKPRPIAIGAKPAGARSDVAPKIIRRNIKVITTSVNMPDVTEYPPGEALAIPFEASPPS